MKILTQSNKLVFFKELAKLQSVVPVFVLFATLIMLWAAASQVHAVLGIKEAERSIATLPKFTVVRKKGDLAMYEEYAQVLGRISPSVAVKVVPDGIQVSTASAQFFPEFMYVLNSVQGVKEGIVWEASEICLMKCQNASSKALLKGFVEQVNVEIRD